MLRELNQGSAHVTIYEDAFNKRIRLDDYSGDVNEITALLDAATPDWTEKVIIKSRPEDIQAFLKAGFPEEAFIKGYFRGDDMHFLARYLSRERALTSKEEEESAIVQAVLASGTGDSFPPTTTEIMQAKKNDAEDLAKLYRETFAVYPTPVGDPAFVLKTMIGGTRYVYVRENGRIVSAASAEINGKYRNAELTDCATADGFQGKGYMRALLLQLENNLISDGISCLYTIARAESFGMNKAFHQLGYTFGGRMTNNCFIYSGLEDMNVWYKN